ncbi:RluA family pseudouridine synthase [Buchnera aphidicola]|uniref:RluA family pseudouridine synthase n=1 Tax=Buchnera aphidicola TaxID=9 RepID=UPI0031B8521B
MKINVMYEDQYILIINKPAGLVVHPGAGNKTGTLLNFLLKKYNFLSVVPRAGIVHRLDKNTTGLMIIAKDIYTYYKMIDLIKKRKVVREYDAFISGILIQGGIIDVPIMRDKNKKNRMMIHYKGKKAITNYKIIQHFHHNTHVYLTLYSGRTHQIRVHMLSIQHPVFGDTVYNFNMNDLKKKLFYFDYTFLQSFQRQALHASHIKFLHPITQCVIDCYLKLPKDMIELMQYI